MAVRRSLIFSLSQRYLSMAVSLLSTIVLARLLTPEEMGIFFVAAALMLAVHTIANFGVLHYMVQEARLTRGRLRAAVGVITVASLGTFALLWAIRGPVAAFYDEPALVDVLTIYGLTLLTIPLNTPAVAWLQRDMRFDAVLVIGLTGTVVQAVTAVTLAAYGWSYMALAWAALAEQAGITAATVVYRGRDTWVWPGIRGWRKVVRIGASVSASQLLQEMGNLAPQLAIGRLQGFDAAGLFNRGLTAVNIFQRSFLEAVKPVILPAFSRTRREGGDVADQLVQTSAHVAAIAWPFFAVTGIMAFPIVRLLFGPQWDAAVPVVRVLALTGLAMPLNTIYVEVLIALGRSGTVFRIQSAVQAVRIAATIPLAAVSITAVAAALAGAAVLQLVLGLGALRRASGVRLRGLARAMRGSAVVTLLAAAGPLAVTVLADRMQMGVLPMLATGGGLAALGWAIGIFATGHPLAAELRGLVRLLRSRLPAVYQRSTRRPAVRRPGARPSVRPSARHHDHRSAAPALPPVAGQENGR